MQTRRMNMRMSQLKLLDAKDIVLTLVDFQPATFFGVESHDRLSIIHNTAILAKTAKLFEVPTVISTIAKDTFAGPNLREIDEVFPNEKIIDRTSINAWIDADFRKAITSTKRKRVVIAGLWTEACVLFPTIEMLAAGFEVFVATDACGDVSKEAHERAVTRMVQAGAVPITSLQFLCELQQDWARQKTYEGVMEILRAHTPYGIQVDFSKTVFSQKVGKG